MALVLNGTTGITSVNGSAAAPSVTGADTDTGIVYGTNTLSLATGGTTAVTVDSSQNVGIGTSSPAQKLDVQAADYVAIRAFSDNSDVDTRLQSYSTNGTGYVGTISNHPFFVCTNNTERMRIDTSGNLLVGTTSLFNNGTGISITASQNTYGGAAGGLSVYNAASSGADASPPLVVAKAMTTTTSSARFIQFYASGTTTAMGGIVGNGASNVQFASISDVREKTNIQDIVGSLEKINSLRPVEFDWIIDGTHVNAGFVAQEVEQVFPEFVVDNMANDGQEERKGLTGGMTGGIIAHLVKAIQELKAELDAAKADIAALKAPQ